MFEHGYQDGRTALFRAAERKEEGVLREQLSLGANPNLGDNVR